MGILIVGGDQVEGIQNYLKAQGYDDQIHWSARRHGDCHKKIPSSINLVLMLTDYLNHGMMYSIKQRLKGRPVKMVFCRNSVADLQRAWPV